MADLDRLVQTLRSIERRGVRLDNQALALVRAHYRRLNLDALVELLDTVAVIENRAVRLGHLGALLDQFDRLAAVLGQPPGGTRELLESATRLGIQATTELLDAQGEGLYYDLPAARELDYVRRSAERLDSYWGPHLTTFREQVQGVLEEGLDRGQLPGEMVARLRERTGVSRSKASLILRNEVGNAQAHALEQDQREMGYDRYTWSTAKDSRVRPEHQAREGKVYRWDQPPSDGHPGAPILCRCVAIPKVG